MRAPGLTTAGSQTDALTSHLYLARWIAEDGTVDVAETPSLGGASLEPLFADPTAKIRDAAFEDQEHELYDLREDPHELVNCGVDPAFSGDLRQRFAELRAIEHEDYGNGY